MKKKRKNRSYGFGQIIHYFIGQLGKLNLPNVEGESYKK